MIRVLIFLLISSATFAQVEPHCSDPEFSAKVNDYVRGTVPLIDVNDLNEQRDKFIVLDAREPDEYRVSHIAGATNIGYDKPDYNILAEIPTDAAIVVYCSIGYRSEKIGEKLIQRGYNNVSNLYGGIFEWGNRSFDLVNKDGHITDTLHTFSRSWSKWANPEKVKRTW